MRETRPERSASAASIIRPVRIISIAFDLPTARVRRWVPPAPGITPSLISGWPNLAVSAARMKSHIIAISHPPPSAKPATAAMIGFRAFATFSQREMKSPTKASAKVLSCISLMSAPAANAFSEPVSTIAPIAGSDSKASSAALRSSIKAADSAFRACGRLSLMRPTAPCVSTRMLA